jgi:PAS domain S-box-containing protein
MPDAPPPARRFGVPSHGGDDPAAHVAPPRVGVERFIDPADHEAILDLVADLERGASGHLVVRLRTATGELPVRLTLRPLHGDHPLTAPADDRAAGWPDVDQLVQAYEELAESEARFRLLAENASDVVVHATPEGVYDWVSPSITDLLGWLPEDLIGKPIGGLPHPDDVAGLQSSGFRDRPAEARGRVRMKDGGWRWMAARARPLRDGAGRLTGFVSSNRDIQAEVEAEERALATEVDLSRIIDGMIDACVVLDAIRDPDGGIVDLRYRVVNEAAAAWFGVERDRLVGATITEVLPPDRAAASIERYAEAIDGGQPVILDDVPAASGMGQAGHTYDIRGTGIGDRVCIIWRDVTERTRARAELERRVEERTAALQTANDELEAFTYTVSHDLRSPVRAIAGFSRLLDRSLGDSLEPADRHRLENIATAAESMGRLIDDLLAFSRVGRQQVRQEPVPLAPIVDRLRATHADVLAQTGGRIDLAESATTPLADPTLVEQILVNLVGNAVAYRRPDAAPTIVVSATADGDRVLVEVSDNGIGIAEDQLTRIFEVFTRTSLDADASHSGIGLATVRRAAHAMGAEVTVTSRPGVGSTFSIVLPRAADT